MKKIIILIIILLIIWGGYSYFNKNTQPTTEIPNRTDEVMCTMDARMCPDGSYVGRQGPNCQFQMCPDGTDVNEQTPEIIQ